MKASKYSKFMGNSDLSKHAINGGKHSSKKWVSQKQIQDILRKLKDYVAQMNLKRKSIFEITRILNSMEILVSYKISSKKSLPELYYDFWLSWDEFKRILFFSVRPEDFCSAIRTQLSKAADILYASKNIPDDKYDQDKFDYLYNKIDLIYESLQGIPDIHSCKRIFTVVAQNSESFFNDQTVAENFLKKIRRCIKAIQGYIESIKPVIDTVQESENQLKELVPNSLTLVRGKSVSQNKCYANNKEKSSSPKGPPSFAAPITKEISSQIGLRSIKQKFGTSSRAKSVTPIRSSMSYISVSSHRNDNTSNLGDHTRKSSKLQSFDKKSVSGASFHGSNHKH